MTSKERLFIFIHPETGERLTCKFEPVSGILFIYSGGIKVNEVPMSEVAMLHVWLGACIVEWVEKQRRHIPKKKISRRRSKNDLSLRNRS